MIIGDGSDRCPRCSGKVVVRTFITAKAPHGWQGRCVVIDVECYVCEWVKKKYVQLEHMLVDR